MDKGIYRVSGKFLMGNVPAPFEHENLSMAFWTGERWGYIKCGNNSYPLPDNFLVTKSEPYQIGESRELQ